MIGIAVNVADTKSALAGLLDSIQKAAWDSLADALEHAEQSGKLAIQATTKSRTGRLLRDVDRYREPTNLVGHIVWRAPYSGYMDEGTRPHVIRARNVQFLRFVMNGAVHYRRSVYHPGTAPRPFKALAMASGQMALRDGLTRRIDASAAAFNR